jgi:sugar lactone lactonase YvrE
VVANDGRLIVVDGCNNRIAVFSPALELTTSLTGPTDKPFSFCEGEVGVGGVEVDGLGSAYIADTGNDRIVAYNASGQLLRQWGTSGTGDGQFLHPIDVVVDRQRGIVYVVDDERGDVQAFNRDGSFIRAFGTEIGDAAGGAGIGPNGGLFVASRGDNRVLLFAPDGSLGGFFGEQGTDAGQFEGPCDVAATASAAFVSDSGNGRVQRFTIEGEFGGVITGAGETRLASPCGVAIARDQLYVTDTDSGTVAIFGVPPR